MCPAIELEPGISCSQYLLMCAYVCCLYVSGWHAHAMVCMWKSQPLEVGGSPAAVQGLNSDLQACTASTFTY